MAALVLIDMLRKHVGKEISVSEWMQIEQDRIDAFANCTGDYQWIHTNPGLAKEGPFQATIAHGYLLLSLLVMMSDWMRVRAEEATVINYGLNKVRFLSPVKTGSKIRNHAVIMKVEEKSDDRILVTAGNSVEIEGERKPALVAETLTMLLTKPSKRTSQKQD
jgi:acyl dehydratase